MKSAKIAQQDFLLEIGAEELPADYLVEAQLTLMRCATAQLDSVQGFEWESLESWAGPRRLILYVKGLKPQVRWEKSGPAKTAAYDSQGNPTQAAIGFAKTQGIPIEGLKLKETPKGLCVFAEHTRPTLQQLAGKDGAIAVILRQLRFPKQMRWLLSPEEKSVAFARPVRWLTALYGSKVVSVPAMGVIAGNKTQGLRRKGLPWISVASASSYFSVVRKNGIQLEQNWKPVSFPPEGRTPEFKKLPPKATALQSQLNKMAHKLGGRLDTSDETRELITHVSFLAEFPAVEPGSFKKEYLSLPAEVLATSMAKHLKAFSLRSADGKFLPKFMAVLEGKPPKPAVVMGNYERILEARFKDAQFFWKEDSKTTLEQKSDQLKHVVFHKQLGTLEQKTIRLKALLEKSPHLDGSLRKTIERAVVLAKADLVTQMVREFPTLQGVMGGEYAKQDGEPQAVSLAIREQYQPRSASDKVPASDAGAWLSLLDKADTLVGFFGVGLQPTSSADPYGLRRQALGMVRILVEKKISLSLDALWKAAIESWSSTIRMTVSSKTPQQLNSFVLDRFRWWALETQNHPRELVDVVLSGPTDDLYKMRRRLDELQALWSNPKQREEILFKAGKIMERTGRMIQSTKEAAQATQVDPEKFKTPEEQKLWKQWSVVKAATASWLEKENISQATIDYGKLYPEVHAFFEKVFIMDNDPAVRLNRLAMMKDVYSLYANAAGDLSKLPLPKDV